MFDFDDLGKAEGWPLGPTPGNGAVVYQLSGEADFDGFPGNELPLLEAVKRKLTEDAPAPFDASAS